MLKKLKLSSGQLYNYFRQAVKIDLNIKIKSVQNTLNVDKLSLYLQELIDLPYLLKRYPTGPKTHAEFLSKEKEFDPNPLFISKFYCAQLNFELNSKISPLKHYLLEGTDLGLNPSPLFNTNHYLSISADVAQEKINPLFHFLKFGILEGRSPIPFEKVCLKEIKIEAAKILDIDPSNPLGYFFLTAAGCEKTILDDLILTDNRNSKEKLYAFIGAIHNYRVQGLFAEATMLIHDFYIAQKNPESIKKTCCMLLQPIAFISELNNDLKTAIETYELINRIEARKLNPTDSLYKLKKLYITQLYEEKGIDYVQTIVELQNNSVGQYVENEIISVKNYCYKHQKTYQEFRAERSILPPDIQFFEEHVKLESMCGDLTAAAQYLSFLNDCHTFSKSNVILIGNYAVYDKAAHPLSADMVFGDSICIAQKNDKILIEHSIKKSIYEKHGLMMFGVQSDQYGHWLVEFLPRMLTFDSETCPSNIPIYIDEGMPESHLESLKLLNTRKRRIIKMPIARTVNFGRLGVSPVPAFFPLDTKPGRQIYDTVWPSDMFEALRTKVLTLVAKKLPKAESTPKWFFISRKAYSSRQIVNEDEIRIFLESIGFHTITPEKLTFINQVKLFRDAEIIIGSCNSSLTNCLFSNKNCKVLGLIHDLNTFNYRGFASIITAGGAELLFVRGERKATEENKHPFHSSFTIPLQKLKSALIKFLCSGSSNEDNSKHIDLRKNLINELFFQEHVSQYSPSLTIQDYLLMGAKAALNPNPFFCDSYYRKQLSDPLPPLMTPLEHYLYKGARLGLNPSPFFNTTFYFELYSDVGTSNMNPLTHFIHHGYYEGRLPISFGTANLSELANISAENLKKGISIDFSTLLLTLYRTYQGDIAQTISFYTSITSISFQRLFLSGLISIADKIMEEGRRLETLEIYKFIVPLIPDNFFLRLQLGLLLTSLGYIEEAQNQFKLILESDVQGDIQKLAQTEFNILSRETQKINGCIEQAKIAFAKSNIKAGLDLIKQIQIIKPDIQDFNELVRNNINYPINNVISNYNIESVPNRLLLFDTSFPSKFSSFRYGELLAYLKYIPESDIYSQLWDARSLEKTNFIDLALRLNQEENIPLERINAFHPARNFDAKIIYCVFLINACSILEHIESQKKSKLIFTLFPGGEFDLNRPKTDLKLNKIFTSKHFEQVIVTNNLSYNYLIEKELCDPTKILSIFGGPVPMVWSYEEKEFIRENYKDSARAINVCFVAKKYTAFGIEKGYDVFAKLVQAYANDTRIHFHIIGDWTNKIFDLSNAKNVTFYGIQPASFFESFYLKMDAIISPNISSYELNGGCGSFDGFPTTGCVEAGLNGVAMFLTDSLGLNNSFNGTPVFIPGEEFELINRDIDQIIAVLEKYLDDPCQLSKLGMKGRQALLREFNFQKQMIPRIDFLKSKLYS